MQTRSKQQTTDDVEIDLRATADDDGERWLTVSEASELVGVSGAAIRAWYRSGRIATQRAAGDRGAYLVPLSAILRLGVDAEELDEDDDAVLDLDTGQWSIETSALRRELDDIRRQVEFLREQLAESAACERAATARAEAAEAELARMLEISAATSSITDPSWLELATNRYESPVRRQASRPVEVEPIELVGDAVDEAIADAEPEIDVPARAPRRPPGQHVDDLLPEAERRLRRGRR